jgi:hypothetical protein
MFERLTRHQARAAVVIYWNIAAAVSAVPAPHFCPNQSIAVSFAYEHNCPSQ